MRAGPRPPAASPARPGPFPARWGSGDRSRPASGGCTPPGRPGRAGTSRWAAVRARRPRPSPRRRPVGGARS
ncbi:hypothetical protein DFI_07320 [Deinococcus ficus]|uniref:Uncharacterized protein n=1 Tax=Deinococcus ficus TaxID=317577 RepID=A0A221SW28_9DEIO|nr:hypothetical protein DFI_07320 [Deinococcus ficus]